MSDRVITNQIYVDEMPIYEFATKDLPMSLKGLAGEAKTTIEIGDKTYVKNWLPTPAQRTDLAKGKKITVRELKTILPPAPAELEAPR